MHNCLTSIHNNAGGNSEIWYAAEFIKCTMYSMSTFSKEKNPTISWIVPLQFNFIFDQFVDL
jgi:hypothetical protein